MKTCCDCIESKPLDEFHKNARGRDGYSSRCKLCNGVASRRWAIDHPEAMTISRRKKTLKAYGLTPESYQTLYDSQDGQCPICQEALIVANIDHNHITNETRGILCPKCNRGLGMFGDDADTLRRAAVYLDLYEPKI